MVMTICLLTRRDSRWWKSNEVQIREFAVKCRGDWTTLSTRSWPVETIRCSLSAHVKTPDGDQVLREFPTDAQESNHSGKASRLIRRPDPHVLVADQT
jgi:hypothetical protein